MSISFEKTIPILRIFDEDRAREFYVGFLGFQVDWEHRFGPGFPLYMQVSRAGMTLHLSGHHGDCCPGSTVFIWMSGLGAYHAEISGTNYPFNCPAIEQTFYEARMLEVIDPFGNRLRFHEADPAPAG